MSGTTTGAGLAAGIGLAVTLALASATLAAAEPAFSAEDAANIDWAWKNCGLVGTVKEHRLADVALTSGGPAFRPAYEKFYAHVTASVTTKTETSDMCTRLRGLYGNEGTHIANLLVPKGASTAEQPPTSAPKAAAGKGSGKGGGGGRHGGGVPTAP